MRMHGLPQNNNSNSILIYCQKPTTLFITGQPSTEEGKNHIIRVWDTWEWFTRKRTSS